MVVFVVMDWPGRLCCPCRMIAVRREVVDVPDVPDAVNRLRWLPRHNKRDRPVLAFGRPCQPGSSPAELGFRLPKAVEQDGQLAGNRDAGALGAFGLGEGLAPCL